MTPRELEAALMEHLPEISDPVFTDGPYPENYNGDKLSNFYHEINEEGSVKLVEGLGNFKTVHSSSKYDEEGDTEHLLVFEFNGVNYGIVGYLDSWNGGTWDTTLQVYKSKKVITEVWEPVR